MIVIILDHRPTKLSAVNPHAMENEMRRASVVPRPQRTRVAIVASAQLRGMTMRGLYLSER
jgi:hypothetical protein